MKLEGLNNIRSMQFDIPNRKLAVWHTDSYHEIFRLLESLKFDTTIVSSVTAEIPAADEEGNQRRLLWQVLAINCFFFGLELLTGFISNSMGLVADSLDMLADSIVYGLALMAVGGTLLRKKQIARVAGYFQLLLALLGLAEVLRRFAMPEEVPVFQTMVIISALALAGNSICLVLLQKSKSKEAHIQASMIFTSNDVVVNLGVMVAGGLVYLTHSRYPDLVVGAIIFAVVIKGVAKIFRLSK